MRTQIALAALLLSAVSAPVLAGPGGEQRQARKELRAGKILSVREIEAAVIPTMQGWEYLGFEYDPNAYAYRLKFLRQGRVVFVDVDARSGEVMRQLR